MRRPRSAPLFPYTPLFRSGFPWRDYGRGDDGEPVFELVDAVLVFGQVAPEVGDVHVFLAVGRIGAIDAVRGCLQESWLWWHWDGALAESAPAVLCFPLVIEHLLGLHARIGRPFGVVPKRCGAACGGALLDPARHAVNLLAQCLVCIEKSPAGIAADRDRLLL